jgi:hypothetical protein
MTTVKWNDGSSDNWTTATDWDDNNGGLGGPGGSKLTVRNTLTNIGTIGIGTSNLNNATTVKVGGLDNTGTINLYGNASANANANGTLAVTENVNNDGGTINVYDDSALTVGGNYTQAAPATLTLQASSTTVYSSLAPAGGVNIAGGQLFFDAHNVSLTAGQTYNLFTFAGGDLQGVYDTLRVDNSTGASTDVNLGNNLTAGLVYDDAAGDIQLQIAATPTTTADSWNFGPGNFGGAGDWSNGPTRFYSDVTIGATTPGTVTVSSDATIDSLTLDGGSSLTSNSGTDFTIGNGLTTQANATLTIGGESFIDGATSNSGAVTIEGTLLDVRGAVTGSGDFILGGAGSELELGNTVAAGETVTFSGADTILKLDDPTGFAATLANIALGDKIDLTGTLLQGTPTVSGDTLSFTDTHNNTYDYTLSGLPSGVDFTTQSDGAGGDYLIAQAACYARGTRILTQRGEVAVEDLRVGDLVVTASGGLRSRTFIPALRSPTRAIRARSAFASPHCRSTAGRSRWRAWTRAGIGPTMKTAFSSIAGRRARRRSQRARGL